MKEDARDTASLSQILFLCCTCCFSIHFSELMGCFFVSTLFVHIICGLTSALWLLLRATPLSRWRFLSLCSFNMWFVEKWIFSFISFRWKWRGVNKFMTTQCVHDWPAHIAYESWLIVHLSGGIEETTVDHCTQLFLFLFVFAVFLLSFCFGALAWRAHFQFAIRFQHVIIPQQLSAYGSWFLFCFHDLLQNYFVSFVCVCVRTCARRYSFFFYLLFADNNRK